MTDSWNPDQYHRFRAERAQPFHDLVALVAPGPVDRLVDLGCGSGELTAVAAERLGAGDALGLDTSAAMLAEAAIHTRPGLQFARGDLLDFDASAGPVDVVISNAALQWVPDHPAVLARWASALGPGGQLAVQVPANADHPSHTVIDEVAAEAPFASAMGATPPPDPVRGVLAPEVYAQVLHDLGFADQHVRLQVYGHVLDSTADVVEWMKGTALTRIHRVLERPLYDRFVDRYRDRLLEVLGHRQPYFFGFKRTLVWARR